MNLFKQSRKTDTLNSFLKESGAVMKQLVDENDKLWTSNIKTSNENEILKESLALHSLGHDMARAGRLEYRQIPEWVRTKQSGQHTAQQLRAMYQENIDLSPADSGKGKGTKKTSGPREIAAPKAPSSISDRSMQVIDRMNSLL